MAATPRPSVDCISRACSNDPGERELGPAHRTLDIESQHTVLMSVSFHRLRLLPNLLLPISHVPLSVHIFSVSYHERPS